MRLVLVILLLVLTVSGFGQKNKSNSKTTTVVSAFDKELNAALKLVASEQYENAGQAFEELLKKAPGNGDVYYYYGEAVINDYLSDTLSNSLKEMGGKANELFQKGIQQDPANQLNNVGLGAICLLVSNDTLAADKYFVKAEASIPPKQKMCTAKDARVLTKLGSSQLLGTVNRYNKAINYLTRAKAIAPNDAAIYLASGDVYIRNNDMNNALANYNKALSLEPTSPLAKIKIGNIYVRANNLNAARPYLDEAREIDSTFAPVYRELGELYTKAGQPNLAKTNFRKFIDLSGNNIPAKIQYSKALFRAKDFTNALTTIEEVLAVDKSRNYLNRLAAYCCYDKKPPELEKGKMYMDLFFKNTNPEAIIPRDYLYYSRILYKVAKNDSLSLLKAFDSFNKAYEMDSNNVNLVSEIASDYYYSRMYKNAIKWINKKNTKGKSDKDDLMLIGKSYYQLGEYKNADSLFNKVIVNQPENIQAYVYSARTASSLDPSSELGLAQPKFELLIGKVGSETTKYAKELQEAYTYLGYYYLQKKDFETSKSWYKKLFELDPANKQWQIQSLKAQALIAYREKNYIQARDLYTEIKKLDPSDLDAGKAIQDLNKAIAAAQKK
ncbi:MAG TPA: tetratricopeptide repeat protein [Prolixibacteraceae bacterium]|jgi:tetratricopeptide (TPR) repeat protein